MPGHLPEDGNFSKMIVTSPALPQALPFGPALLHWPNAALTFVIGLIRP
jgi:hypothetical protein